MTAVVDEIDSAFERALLKDAGAAEPPEIPAPPRVDRDPDAPHGRTEDGSPLAPYGFNKRSGKPNIKPAPVKPGKQDKPRVATAQAPKGSGPDYTGDLMSTGTAVWFAASGIHGFGVGKRKTKDGTEKPFIAVPDLRPYAAVFHQQLPVMAGAWAEAARQNSTVRGYVEKLASDGSMTWLIGVAITTAGFVGGCAAMAKAPQDIRDQATAANDQMCEEYVGKLTAAMGMQEAA